MNIQDGYSERLIADQGMSDATDPDIPQITNILTSVTARITMDTARGLQATHGGESDGKETEDVPLLRRVHDEVLGILEDLLSRYDELRNGITATDYENLALKNQIDRLHHQIHTQAALPGNMELQDYFTKLIGELQSLYAVLEQSNGVNTETARLDGTILQAQFQKLIGELQKRYVQLESHNVPNVVTIARLEKEKTVQDQRIVALMAENERLLQDISMLNGNIRIMHRTHVAEINSVTKSQQGLKKQIEDIRRILGILPQAEGWLGNKISYQVFRGFVKSIADVVHRIPR